MTCLTWNGLLRPLGHCPRSWSWSPGRWRCDHGPLAHPGIKKLGIIVMSIKSVLNLFAIKPVRYQTCLLSNLCWYQTSFQYQNCISIVPLSLSNLNWDQTRICIKPVLVSNMNQHQTCICIELVSVSNLFGCDASPAILHQLLAEVRLVGAQHDRDPLLSHLLWNFLKSCASWKY